MPHLPRDTHGVKTDRGYQKWLTNQQQYCRHQITRRWCSHHIWNVLVPSRARFSNDSFSLKSYIQWIHRPLLVLVLAQMPLIADIRKESDNKPLRRNTPVLYWNNARIKIRSSAVAGAILVLATETEAMRPDHCNCEICELLMAEG